MTKLDGYRIPALRVTHPTQRHESNSALTVGTSGGWNRQSAEGRSGYERNADILDATLGLNRSVHHP
jgi:hypothetical protein